MSAALRKLFFYAWLNCLFFCFYWGTHMYMPYYYQQAGLSDRHIGFLISIVSLTTIAVVFPIGFLSDRIDPKKLFLAGAAVGIIFAVLFILKPRPGFFEPYIFIFGLAVAMVQTALAAHFLKQVAEDERGNQSALYAIGGLIGAGVGAQLNGALVSHFGAASLFWSTLASAVLLLLFGLMLPRVKGVPFRISQYREDLKHPLALILVFTAFIVASHSGFEHVGYTLLQTREIGLSARQAGKLFMFICIWMSVISWVSGAVHDRAKKPVMWAGIALLVSGVFQSLSGYGQNFYDFLGYRMIHTMGDSFSGVLIMVIASVAFPKKRVGGSWALLLLVRNASDFMFANVAGELNQAIGLRQGFVVSGILVVVAGLVLILFLRPRFWKEIEAVEKTGALPQPQLPPQEP